MEVTMEQKMRCSHCGAEVNGTDVFCGECGTTLNINVEDKREGVDISAENNSYTGGQSENVSYEEPVTNEYGNGNSEQGEPKEQHRNTVTDVKEKANELRAKKGYEVKGVGADKEFIPLNNKNSK